MHVRKVIVLLVYLVPVLFAIVIAKESDKRMQGSPHAFQQMVRYGRSNNKDGKSINVYPRADVFYLGPRYGKRSQKSSHTGTSSTSLLCGSKKNVSCTYAGVSNLYRCSNSRRSAIKGNRI